MQGTGYLLRHFLDTSHGLDIYLLRRELYGRIARMYARKFDVLTDGVHYDFAITCHGVHFYFLGVLYKLRNHHRMFLADISSQTQKALQFIVVGAHIHGCTAEDVAGTYKYRETHLFYKRVDGLHIRQLAPSRLVNTETVKHGREFVPVFGVIYVSCRSAQNFDALPV